MEKSPLSKRKKLLKYLWITLSVCAVLFVVLVVHIYLVTKPVHYDNNDLQLSRIDFKEKLDSTQANEVRHFVATLPGVHNTVFNYEANILVYGFSSGKQSSANVYNELMKHRNYQAEKFVVTDDLKAKGCPMAGKDRSSLVYRVTGYIYKLLN